MNISTMIKKHILPNRQVYAGVLFVGIASGLALNAFVNYANEKKLKAAVVAESSTNASVVAEKAMRSNPDLWLKREYPVSEYLALIKADKLATVGLPDMSTVQNGKPRVLLVTRAGELGYVADTWRGSITERTIADRAAGLHVITVGTKASTLGSILPAILQLMFFGALILLSTGGLSLMRKKYTTARDVTTRFSDVIGATEAKAALQDLVDLLKNPEAYAQVGARPSRGVLMSGPPGTGKTLLAKALAGECGVTFIACSGADFSSKYFGAGISLVKDLFKQARKEEACIIFIDEIDGIGRRTDGDSTGAQESNRIINQLLVELDGFGADSRVIVIGATNLTTHVDPALCREGRFDRKIALRLPDVADRESLLAYYCERLTMAKDIDFAQLARMTPGLSPAAIAALVNQAAMRAARAGAKEVTLEHLAGAIETTHLGELSGAILDADERLRVAVHEAAHAMVAVLRKSGSLEKVTILPRGDALGVTFISQDENKRMRTELDLDHRIDVLLAGRCAEELVFGQPSSGASQDLQVATLIATDMFTRMGFGCGLATLSGDQISDDAVLERVNDRLLNRYSLTYHLIQDNRQALDGITARLLKDETIDGSEVIAMTLHEA